MIRAPSLGVISRLSGPPPGLPALGSFLKGNGPPPAVGEGPYHPAGPLIRAGVSRAITGRLGRRRRTFCHYREIPRAEDAFLYAPFGTSFMI